MNAVGLECSSSGGTTNNSSSNKSSPTTTPTPSATTNSMGSPSQQAKRAKMSSSPGSPYSGDQLSKRQSPPASSSIANSAPVTAATDLSVTDLSSNNGSHCRTTSIGNSSLALDSAGLTCTSGSPATEGGTTMNSVTDQVNKQTISSPKSGINNDRIGSSDANEGDDIDESLYSRQLYVLGSEAMKQMSKTKILVSGMNGVGLEVAKCLVLGGMKEVTLQDDAVITKKDLSSNYYARQESIGVNRAAAVYDDISSLNSYVQVNKVEGGLTRPLIDRFDVIIFCPDQLTQVNIDKMSYCHERSIKYICALSNGIFGTIFNDFGADFLIQGVDGNDPFESFIEGITYDDGKKEVTVICHEDKPHGLGTGSFVQFEQISQVSQLNDLDPIEITYISPISFKFTMLNFDSEQLVSYSQNGTVKEVKMPKRVSFKSIEKCFSDDDVMLFNFGKINHSTQIVASYIECATNPSLQDILTKSTHTADDLSYFANCLENVLRNTLKIDSPETNRKLSDSFLQQYTKGQFAPMCAVIGSIATQEAIKAVTHKFSPIKQWFAIDAIECVSDGAELMDSGDGVSSLEAQILGKHVHEYLSNLKMFLVGSGAIGCELLKLFALLNVASSECGMLTVTDMDTIERSNLNRQFLFRPENIGDFKSSVATNVAKKINPNLKVTALTEAVGPNTENVFNFDFYKSLNIIVNALDNIETRKFTDSKCIFFGLPLLESGTLGTKGNTQVVVPGLTESYSSSNDQPEVSFPMCTIKNFPYTINHTIPWARDFFETKFVIPSKSYSLFSKNPGGYLSELNAMQPFNREAILENLNSTVLDHYLVSFDECITHSLDLMVENFYDQIVQLSSTFPEDHVTSTGTKFWSGLKRFPRPIKLDIYHCNEQYQFVKSASFLFAQLFGINVPKDVDCAIKNVSINYQQKDFVPNSSLKIAADDNELKEMQRNNSQTDSQSKNSTLEKLRNLKISLTQGEEIEFEKDDSTNHQIDFITAASNLRALNYSIKPISRSETKRIAGKIIPAIATTTSLVAGLVAIELCKIPIASKEDKLKIEKFCNTFINLSLPFFTQSEPMPCQSIDYMDTDGVKHSFTLWDKIELNGEMTLREMLNYFENVIKVKVSMISCDASMVFADFMKSTSTDERMNTLVSTIVENIQKRSFNIKQEPGVILNVIPQDFNDEEVEIPYVFYKFDTQHPKWSSTSN